MGAVLAGTGSTNDDAAAVTPAPRTAGGPVGVVVAADHQTGGRGRRGRAWGAPPRTSVAVSVAVVPQVPPACWGWLSLLAGQAVHDCLAPLLAGASGVRVGVKWPNDVLIAAGEGEGKVCGILSEVRGPVVVVGTGINTNAVAGDLPSPSATSLRVATGAVVDPTEVVAGYLVALADLLGRFEAAGGDAGASGLREAHLTASATVGRAVAVHTPTGVVAGAAVDVDGSGRLVVRTSDGRQVALNAGDVVHVR